MHMIRSYIRIRIGNKIQTSTYSEQQGMVELKQKYFYFTGERRKSSYGGMSYARRFWMYWCSQTD